jgi:ribosomal protein L37AE/L43A
MCLVCETEDAEDVEALPDARTMTLAAMRHLYRERVHEINAAKIHPEPVCPDCDYLFHPAESGDIWPEICCSCETRRVESLVHAVAFAKSKRKARKALAKLYRKVR